MTLPNYETLVKMEFLRQYENHTPYTRDTPLFLEVEAYFPIPKSASKKKREMMLSGELRPTVKKDIDNILKAVCDGMIGVVFEDDSSVVNVHASKWYAETPYVTVKVCDLSKEDGERLPFTDLEEE